MAILKLSQDKIPHPQEQQSNLSEALALLFEMLRVYAEGIFRQLGYVPISTDKFLSLYKSRVRFKGMEELEQDILEETEKFVESWIKTVKPDLLKEPGLVNSIAKTLIFVDKIFPVLDTLNYPVGSYNSLALSVAAMVNMFPSGDIEADKEKVKQITKAYYDFFYGKNASIYDKNFMQKTWGIPAGTLGNIVVALAQLGILNPNTQSIEEQLRLLAAYVSAIQAIRIFKQKQTGKEIPIIDAASYATQIASTLGADATPEDLKKQTLKLLILQESFFSSLRSGLPGALPVEEAVKKHVELMQNASNSVMSNALNAIVYAYKLGKIPEGTPAAKIAKDVLDMRVPSIFRDKDIISVQDLALALVKSGWSPDLAYTWITSSIGKSFKAPQVDHVTRMLQGIEIDKFASMAARNVYNAAIRRGYTPDKAKLLAYTAYTDALYLHGYTLQSFKQLHGFENLEQIYDHIDRQAELYSTGIPPLQVSMWQRLAAAARESPKNITDIIAAAFGYAPKEKELQKPLQGAMPEIYREPITPDIDILF